MYWYKDLINPVKLGTSNWIRPGEYTPVSINISNDASPVDFYTFLKRSMVDEGASSALALMTIEDLAGKAL